MGSGTFYAVDSVFWTDPDVVDNFTPEDKYFYLYLLTNGHGNVSGCFQISIKQIADEMGYSKETVEHLIERFVTLHKMIDYSKENKEIIIHKWGKHHWTQSPKHIEAVRRKISEIKTEKFKKYVAAAFEKFQNKADDDTVWIPYPYGMDTPIYPISYIPCPDIQYPIPDKDKEETDEVAELVGEWNRTGFRPIERISKTSVRYKMAKKRIEEYGIEKVLEALYRADKSDFLHGKSDRGWEMDFDWFVKPSNFQKVLEGNYDNRGKKNKTFFDMYKELKDEEDGNCAAVVSY